VALRKAHHGANHSGAGCHRRFIAGHQPMQEFQRAMDLFDF